MLLMYRYGTLQLEILLILYTTYWLTGRRPYNPRAQLARDSTYPKGGSAAAGNSRFIGYVWREREMGRDTIRDTHHSMTGTMHI